MKFLGYRTKGRKTITGRGSIMMKAKGRREDTGISKDVKTFILAGV